MPTPTHRTRTNRANARKSTEPRSPEGEARSFQNVRQRPFDPDPFAVVRIEDRDAIATLFADAIATYQPINSQERAAVERIAVAQHSIRRMYALEAGLFANFLDQALEDPAQPLALQQPELTGGIEIALEQHRAYWFACAFDRFAGQSNIAATFLRFQAQVESLYRRAVEDLHRLLKLRSQLPPEECAVNEPNREPMRRLQLVEDTAARAPGPFNPQLPIEPKAEPRKAGETSGSGARAEVRPGPVLVPGKQPASASNCANPRDPRTAKPRDAPSEPK
jgi:hypothetical protein